MHKKAQVRSATFDDTPCISTLAISILLLKLNSLLADITKSKCYTMAKSLDEECIRTVMSKNRLNLTDVLS